MLTVIRHAVESLRDVSTAESAFDFWLSVYREQETWAASTGYPPLLWGFGVSLVERAVIDAVCRASGKPFGSAVREGALGIRLGDIHPELEGVDPASLLVGQPLRSIQVRHTVGLADPLTNADIPASERLTDGLPQSLEDNIQVYGLTHLKIKLCGDADQDRARGSRERSARGGGAVSRRLDGNVAGASRLRLGPPQPHERDRGRPVPVHAGDRRDDLLVQPGARPE